MENKKPKRKSKTAGYILGTTFGVIAAGGAGFGIGFAVYNDAEAKKEHQIIIEQTQEQTHGHVIEVSPKDMAKKGDKVTFTVTKASASNGVTWMPSAIKITSVPKNPEEKPVTSEYALIANDEETVFTAEVTILYACDMKIELVCHSIEDSVVTFDVNGGTGIYPEQYVPYKNKVQKVADPTWVGHTFKGWYEPNATDPFDFDNTIISGNITLKARWDINVHTVFWVDDNGVPLVKGSFPYGTIPTYPGALPKKDSTAQYSYTFKEWTPKVVPMPDNDVTYKAVFEPTIRTYSIDFVSDSGTIPSTKLNYGEKITAPDVSYVGHTLEGWYTDAGHTTKWDFNNGITGNTKLYANWTVNTYSITYDFAGGTGTPGVTTVQHGGKITKPTNDPTKEGSNFVKWTVDGKDWNFDTDTVTKNITLTAVWDKITYFTVTVDQRNGEAVQTVSLPKDTKITLQVPSWTGHEFKNWINAKDGTAITSEITVTEDMSIYAKWEIDTKTVTFYNEDGTATYSTVDVDYGSTVQRPADPTKIDGKKFVGWMTTKGGTTEFNFDTPIYDKTDVYAKFSDCEVNSISVNTTGATTEFAKGTKFSSDGIVVNAILEDGTTVALTKDASTRGYTLDSSAYNPDVPGTYPIYITHTTTTGLVRTTSYNVKVLPVAVTGITVTNKTVTLQTGETLTTNKPNAKVAPTTATNQNINLSFINGELLASCKRDESTGDISITAGNTAGTAYVIATTEEGLFSDVITVNIHPEYLEVNKLSGSNYMDIPDQISYGAKSFVITRNSTATVGGTVTATVYVDGSTPTASVNFIPSTMAQGATVTLNWTDPVTTSFAIKLVRGA